jgi:nucleoside-diphosphate-sugar epimerase
MDAVLVTGALGQIGSELVPALREKLGPRRVIASDIRPPAAMLSADEGPFAMLDCMNASAVAAVVRRHGIGTIYHLAALLSAAGESAPGTAWSLNIDGLRAVLEVARQSRCAVFFPSSIAAFGPSTPRVQTPQETVQRPATIYGITKLTGELLADYYVRRFGLDVRGLRFPGLVSHVAPPGGGTTDYAVEIFHHAVRRGRYTCFLRRDTALEMMYMPDAIRATLEVMAADPGRLQHRNAYNIAAISLTPERLAAAIRAHIPDFEIAYDVDPIRQAIADSWPRSLDDAAARADWGWAPKYDLEAMTSDMIDKLGSRFRREAAITVREPALS